MRCHLSLAACSQLRHPVAILCVSITQAYSPCHCFGSESIYDSCDTYFTVLPSVCPAVEQAPGGKSLSSSPRAGRVDDLAAICVVLNAMLNECAVTVLAQAKT